ncbi:MAG: PorT family protein [Chitinophagaceae bacterium]|nr:PorT family protein [Chitinophagaceae bacterium]
MKTIKLSLALAISLLFANAMNAQTTFGVRAGVNFQNLNGKYPDGDKRMGKLRTGFNAGVNAEIPVGDGFYLQPGLLYSLKGAKAKGVELPFDVSLSYLEVPINFIYKPDLGQGRMLLGFGPYVAYAVGGKYEIGNTDTDIEFGSEPGELKRFDAGANFLAGYEFANNFSFQLNAQLGLGNMVNRASGDNDSKLNNTGFGVSFGYRFGGR